MLLILDMDGVLIDSEPHWLSVQPRFLAQIIPGWSDVEQRNIWGMSLREVHRKLCAEHHLTLTWSEFLSQYEELGADIYGAAAPLVNGAEQLIERARMMGLRLAVASSSPRAWIELVVKRFHLAEHFAFIASSDDVSGITKPDPAIYQHCLTCAGVSASSAIAIEDSSKGVCAAKRAKIFTIRLLEERGPKQDHAGEPARQIRPALLLDELEADYTVNSLVELTPAILQALFARAALAVP